MSRQALVALLALTACGGHTPDGEGNNVSAPAAPTAPAAPEARVTPPAPGQPCALADDRTPVSEAPFEPTGAQGAADVVQTYYALIEAGKYAEARRLWGDEGQASGADDAAFAGRFAGYKDYRALVGAPGRIEGAAGSLYVEVPVQLYGRLPNGKEYSVTGPVRLRRVNDVAGSTAEQRRWHIVAVEPSPPPS